jgi:hypothetical protein
MDSSAMPEFGAEEGSSMIAEGKESCYRPAINIVQGSPIEILVDGTVGEYIALNSCFLWVRIRILRRDGTAPAENAVAPVNNILHSMWSSVELELNSKNISGHGMHYPYRAYLENLLSYSPTSMEYHLQNEGWFKDTAGATNTSVLTQHATNLGLRKRAVNFQQGRQVALYGRLHLDLFHQESLLPPSVPFRVKLTPALGKHCLITPPPADDHQQIEYRIQIDECKLIVKKLIFHPKITLDAHKAHQLASYSYPLRTAQLKLITLGNNIASFRETFVTGGQIPCRVILAFVSQAAHDGSFQENPFHFAHHNLSEIHIRVNDKIHPSRGAIRSNYANGDYLEAYTNTLQALGKLQGNKPLAISFSEFANGFNIHAFDLTREQTASSDNTYVQKGSCTAYLDFEAPLAHPIYMLIYEEYQHKLQLEPSNYPIGPL